MYDWVNHTNLWVARSPVGRWFRLQNSGHVCIHILLGFTG